MPDVIIDGVRYIPAKDALANEKAVARALLMQFWGACSDDKLQELIDSPDIRVLVNDWEAGEPLRDVLDEVARQAEGGE